ncbi:MAG: hypothetical protein GVY14_08425 [Spirochaetes bacterium]|jgi:hypothetical protein|nr:hypothetical protein [Spirochaetota bacterium]
MLRCQPSGRRLTRSGRGSPGRLLQALVLAALYLPAAPVAAEVLAPPPAPLYPWAEAAPADIGDPGGAFPATYSWLGVKRYTYDTGAPLFSYDLDLGAHIMIYGNRRVGLSALGRILFQSQTAPGRPLYLDPSAVVTDLQLRLRLRRLPLRPAIWYRHDCKHDMERESRRQAIHDVIGVGFTQRIDVLEGPPGLDLVTGVTAEVFVPPVFQDERTSAAIAAGYLSLRPEVELAAGGPTVFTELRGALLVDDPDSVHAVAGAVRVDAAGRVGLSWPEPTGGITTYVELERLTDAKKRPPEETESYVLLSFGVVMGVEGRRP